MQDLLRQLQTHCDLVVIDSPPVLVVSDTAMLASHADGVLLAFTHEKLRRDPARNTIGALRQVKARILGVVLNRAEGSQHGYYYSYHKSYGNRYYSTHYSSQKQSKTKRVSARSTFSTPEPSDVQPRSNGNGAAATPSAQRAQQPGS